MYGTLCFFFAIIAIFGVSDADTNQVADIKKTNVTKDDGDVLFKNYGNNDQKALKKCNIYVTQACNGILNIQKNISAIQPVVVRGTAMESQVQNANTSIESASLPDNSSSNENPSLSPQYNIETSFEKAIVRNFTIIGNETKYPHLYVVGGRNSAPKEYPHMVLIGYGKYEEVKWLCGGSLISEQYVLSAGHCSSTSAGPAEWVRLGELDLSTKNDEANTNDIQIIERIVHPAYNPPSLYNDIALFKLKTSVIFNDFIRPICLNIIQNVNVYRATATGWGSTGYGETASSRLLSVDLDIQDYRNCDKIYKGERLQDGFNVSTMICAGYAPGGKDTCQGDSGGPLQVPFNAGCSRLYLQIGIVSFGEGCAFPDTPGVYTKVSFFIPWIEGIVWK